MAILTLDIDAEIDKVWHFDIEATKLLMQGGPYAKHLLESFALDDTVYEIGEDNLGRSIYVEVENAAIVIRFLIRKNGTASEKWIVHKLPTEEENGIFTFLGKSGMIGPTSFQYRGFTVTMDTLVQDGAGTIWRATGHVLPDRPGAKGGPGFRSTYDLADQGLTLTQIEAANSPLSVYDPTNSNGA